MQTCRYLVPINLATHLGHFANSAVYCRFLRFSPSNFAFMIRKIPLFLLSIIRRISLIVLKEFRLFTIDARVRTTAKPSKPMQVLQFAIFLIEKNYNYKNYKTSVSFVFIIFVRTCTRFVLRKQNSYPPPCIKIACSHRGVCACFENAAQLLYNGISSEWFTLKPAS